MKNFNVLMIVFGVVLLASVASAQLRTYTDNAALNSNRACSWDGTNTQVASVTASSTLSAQLGTQRVYRVYCATDTWFTQGGSGAVAASTRGTIKAATDFWVRTVAGADYLAFRSVVGAGNCDITECR